MALGITSSAFSEGGMIPKLYTCDGADVSPDLSFSGIPEESKSLALICDDPDAPVGIWVHWVLFNIPTSETGIPAEIDPAEVPVVRLGERSEDGMRRVDLGDDERATVSPAQDAQFPREPTRGDPGKEPVEIVGPRARTHEEQRPAAAVEIAFELLDASGRHVGHVGEHDLRARRLFEGDTDPREAIGVSGRCSSV